MVVILSEALTGWFFDLVSCFVVIGFVFSLKFILIFSKNAKYTWNDITREATTLFSDGQAALLVVTYNITTIRSILTLNYIRYLRGILMTILVLAIIYNVIMYVLVKEVGYIEDEKATLKLSFAFLTISILGSLFYTIAQVYV